MSWVRKYIKCPSSQQQNVLKVMKFVNVIQFTVIGFRLGVYCWKLSL